MRTRECKSATQSLAAAQIRLEKTSGPIINAAHCCSTIHDPTEGLAVVTAACTSLPRMFQRAAKWSVRTGRSTAQSINLITTIEDGTRLGRGRMRVNSAATNII